MKDKSVHQFVPILAPCDAIGNEILTIRESLRRCGYNSEIYVGGLHNGKSSDATLFTEYKPDSNDILIYHHASGSYLVEFLASLPNKLIMIYHNITPPNYFQGIIDDTLIQSLMLGREQLKLLRSKVEVALCDSEFNRQELVQLGYKNTDVLPIMIDFARYGTAPRQEIISKYSDSTNILFVGRIAPNKKIEDLLKLFAYYSKCINCNSRLFVVGGSWGVERYYSWLQNITKTLHLDNVEFIVNADTRELVSYYKIADVFVSMSEHEGFCVPLVESMYFGIPIIAYNCTAIPHTLGDSGILVNEKNYEEIAELIQLIVEDESLRNNIVGKQYKRLSAFNSQTSEKILHEYVQCLVSV